MKAHAVSFLSNVCCFEKKSNLLDLICFSFVCVFKISLNIQIINKKKWKKRLNWKPWLPYCPLAIFLPININHSAIRPKVTQYIISFDVTRLPVSDFKLGPVSHLYLGQRWLFQKELQLDLTVRCRPTPTFFSQVWQPLHIRRDNAALELCETQLEVAVRLWKSSSFNVCAACVRRFLYNWVWRFSLTCPYQLYSSMAANTCGIQKTTRKKNSQT